MNEDDTISAYVQINYTGSAPDFSWVVPVPSAPQVDVAVGGTNYLSLVDATVDLYQGRAFITEYAQPTSALVSMGPQDPLVIELAREYDYVTRFFGRISVHDLSGMKPEVFWGCESLPIEIEYNPQVVPPGFE